MTSAHHEPRRTQGGGYPPGGYGGPPAGGYGPPGSAGGGYPPGGGGPSGPGGYGPPGYGPPAPPYGAPSPAGVGPSWTAPGASQNPELKKKAQTWLIISAASFFFCTSCFGIIGGVLCFMAMQAVEQGNFADAENKLKWGKIITIVGFVLCLLITIGLAVAFGADIMAKIVSP